MSQTSYNLDQRTAVAGLLGDLGDNYVRTYAVKAPVMNIGVAVTVAADGKTCSALAAITDKVAGVTVFSHHLVNTSAPALTVGDQINVISSGQIWVKVEEAVNAQDPAFVRAVATGLQVAGAFRKSADGVTTIDLTGKAKFLTKAAANGFALVDLKL
jgi:hypothetical protein